MPHTTITHFPSLGLDHFPLPMEMNIKQDNSTKYFKFLNCWADHPNFMDTVKQCWEGNTKRNPMWIFHQKMRRLSSTLSSWSRSQFCDIYARVKEYEEKVRKLKMS